MNLLTSLAPQRAVTSNAALAVSEAFVQGGPGLCLSIDALRRLNHPHRSRQFVTFFHTHYHMAICVFPDHSAVVGRVDGDILRALPALFHLRKHTSPKGPTFVIKRGNHPLVSINTMDAWMMRSDHTTPAPQQSWQDDPAWQTWLQNLTQDLHTLSPQTFKPTYVINEAYIKVKETVLNRSMALVHDLPEKSIGHRFVQPAFMPQTGYTLDEGMVLRTYMQDFLDWVFFAYKDYGLKRVTSSHHATLKATSLSIEKINVQLGLDTYQTHTLPACNLVSQPHLFAPVVPDNIQSFFFDVSNKYQHDVKYPALYHLAAKPDISAHRAMDLTARWGEGVDLKDLI